MVIMHSHVSRWFGYGTTGPFLRISIQTCSLDVCLLARKSVGAKDAAAYTPLREPCGRGL